MYLRLLLVTLFIFYSCLIIIEPRWRDTDQDQPFVIYFYLIAHLIIFPYFFWVGGRAAMRSLEKADSKTLKFMRESVKRILYPLALNDLILGPFVAYVSNKAIDDTISFGSFYRPDRYVVGSGIGWSLGLLFIFHMILLVIVKVLPKASKNTGNLVKPVFLVFAVVATWLSVFGLHMIELGLDRNLRIFDIPYLFIHCLAFTLGCMGYGLEFEFRREKGQALEVSKDTIKQVTFRPLLIFGAIVGLILCVSLLICIPFLKYRNVSNLLIALLETVLVVGFGTSVHLGRKCFGTSTVNDTGFLRLVGKRTTSYLIFVFHHFIVGLSLLGLLNWSFFTSITSLILRSFILFTFSAIISWLACTFISWLMEAVLDALVDRMKLVFAGVIENTVRKYWSISRRE